MNTPENRVTLDTELRERDEQYRNVFEATGDALIIGDLEGYVVEANPAACEIYGYTHDELIGVHASALVHPDYHARVIAGMEVINAGRAFPLEMICMRKDGTTFHFEGRGTAFTYRHKPHVLSAGRDVTERVRTEQLLREQEQQYRSIFGATHDGLVIASLDGVIVEANSAACEMHGCTYEDFVGRSAATFLHQEYRQKVAECIHAIRAGTTYAGDWIAVRRDGTPFYLAVNATPFSYKGNLHILATMRDVTERMQTRELLEQRVADRTREMAALLDISHTMTSTLELQPLLGVILDQFKTLVDYTAATIMEWSEEQLHAIGYRGPLPPEVVLGTRYPAPLHDPATQEMSQRETMIIPDIYANTPEAEAVRELIDPQVLEITGVRCWLAVPMVSGERAIGLLSLAHRQPHFYTARHASLALAIANQAAIAIENARLYERAQEVAVVEERQRLSRELHDSVSQALYGIALGAQTARVLAKKDPTRVGEPIEYVLGQAERALTEMRALILELRPEALETEGLVSMLEHQGAAIRVRHELAVQMELGPEPDAPLPLKEALYRIAQEALHNTIKHAQAGMVRIALVCSAAEVVLEVQDNGRGFDTGAAYPGHIGLQSMKERAARLGGTVEVESIAGEGTRVRARIARRPSA